MKILAITAHHPPYHSGGYEIRVKNILDELKIRGHEILVITSKTNSSNDYSEVETLYPISRVLHSTNRKMNLIDRMTTKRTTRLLGLALVFIREIFHDLTDLRTLDRMIRQFQPDIVYLGQIIPLVRTIIPYLANFGNPVVLDDGGGTLVEIRREKGIWFKLIEDYVPSIPFLIILKLKLIRFIVFISKNRMKPSWFVPENMHVFFKREKNFKTSTEKGIRIDRYSIIPSGVNEQRIPFKSKDSLTPPILIIYPARIEPRKGQLDALKLIQELLNKDVDADLYLYGDIRETFLPELERVITTFSLRDKVYINPQIPHEELIQCYQKSDICFFPSYWEDGLSRVPMEAMASGCIVISYGNEGSNEIIRNRENGFLVHAGHYDEIIRIIKELLSDPELVKSIQQQARKDIEDKYSIQKYIDKVEKQLTQMIENA